MELNRKLFVESLIKSLVARKIRALIVFDSHSKDTPDYPSASCFGEIDVIFSPSGKCADSYILEYISTLFRPKEFTIVTSDQSLSNQAKEFGVFSMSIQDFCLFLYKNKGEEALSIKPNKEDPYSFERYLAIFEESYSRLNSK